MPTLNGYGVGIEFTVTDKATEPIKEIDSNLRQLQQTAKNMTTSMPDFSAAISKGVSKGASSSAVAVETYTKAAEENTKSITKMSKSTEKLNQPIETLTGNTRKARDSAHAFAVDMAASAFSIQQFGVNIESVGKHMVGAVMGVGKSIVQTGMEVQGFKMSLNALYSGKGDLVFKNIEQYALKSVFSLEQLIPAVIMMKSVGLEAMNTLAPKGLQKKQTLLDYAADLAATIPNIRNSYGTGVEGAMGAIKEYISEGNTITIRRSTGLDVEGILGEKKGADMKKRTQQIADLIYKVKAFGKSSALFGTPMQQLSTMQDIIFYFWRRVADTGAYKEFCKELTKVTTAIMDFVLKSKDCQALIQAVGEGFKSFMPIISKVADRILKLVYRFSELARENPKLISQIMKITAVTGLFSLALGKVFIGLSQVGYTILAFSQTGHFLLKELPGFFTKLREAQGVGRIFGLLCNTLVALAALWTFNVFGVRDLAKAFKQLDINNVRHSFEMFYRGFAQGFKSAAEGVREFLSVFGSWGGELGKNIVRTVNNIVSPKNTEAWKRFGEIVGKLTIAFMALKSVLITIKALSTVGTFMGLIPPAVEGTQGGLAALIGGIKSRAINHPVSKAVRYERMDAYRGMVIKRDAVDAALTPTIAKLKALGEKKSFYTSGIQKYDAAIARAAGKKALAAEQISSHEGTISKLINAISKTQQDLSGLKSDRLTILRKSKSAQKNKWSTAGEWLEKKQAANKEIATTKARLERLYDIKDKLLSNRAGKAIEYNKRIEALSNARGNLLPKLSSTRLESAKVAEKLDGLLTDRREITGSMRFFKQSKFLDGLSSFAKKGAAYVGEKTGFTKVMGGATKLGSSLLEKIGLSKVATKFIPIIGNFLMVLDMVRLGLNIFAKGSALQKGVDAIGKIFDTIINSTFKLIWVIGKFAILNVIWPTVKAVFQGIIWYLGFFPSLGNKIIQTFTGLTGTEWLGKLTTSFQNFVDNVQRIVDPKGWDKAHLEKERNNAAKNLTRDDAIWKDPYVVDAFKKNEKLVDTVIAQKYRKDMSYDEYRKMPLGKRNELRQKALNDPNVVNLVNNSMNAMVATLADVIHKKYPNMEPTNTWATALAIMQNNPDTGAARMGYYKTDKNGKPVLMTDLSVKDLVKLYGFTMDNSQFKLGQNVGKQLTDLLGYGNGKPAIQIPKNTDSKSQWWADTQGKTIVDAVTAMQDFTAGFDSLSNIDVSTTSAVFDKVNTIYQTVTGQASMYSSKVFLSADSIATGGIPYIGDWVANGGGNGGTTAGDVTGNGSTGGTKRTNLSSIGRHPAQVAPSWYGVHYTYTGKGHSKGGETTGKGLALLHDNEVIVNSPTTNRLKEFLAAQTNGNGYGSNVTFTEGSVVIHTADGNPQEIARKLIPAIQRELAKQKMMKRV